MNLKEKLFEIQGLGLVFEKNAENPFFKSKYLTLDKLWATLQPEVDSRRLLVSHGVIEHSVVTQVIDVDSDDVIVSSFPIPEGLDMQKMGGAVTYAKRYNMGMLFNIMTDSDDDGNSTQKETHNKVKTHIDEDEGPKFKI